MGRIEHGAPAGFKALGWGTAAESDPIASIGLIRAARRAGTQLVSDADPDNGTPTTANLAVIGLPGVDPRGAEVKELTTCVHHACTGDLTSGSSGCALAGRICRVVEGHTTSSTPIR